MHSQEAKLGWAGQGRAGQGCAGRMGKEGGKERGKIGLRPARERRGEARRGSWLTRSCRRRCSSMPATTLSHCQSGGKAMHPFPWWPSLAVSMHRPLPAIPMHTGMGSFFSLASPVQRVHRATTATQLSLPALPPAQPVTCFPRRQRVTATERAKKTRVTFSSITITIVAILTVCLRCFVHDSSFFSCFFA